MPCFGTFITGGDRLKLKIRDYENKVGTIRTRKKNRHFKFFEKIEDLERELSHYEGLDLIKEKSYRVRIALFEIKGVTENLKSSLEEIIRQAEDWEGLE